MDDLKERVDQRLDNLKSFMDSSGGCFSSSQLPLSSGIDSKFERRISELPLEILIGEYMLWNLATYKPYRKPINGGKK